MLETHTDFQLHYCELVKNEVTDAANEWLDVAKCDAERSKPNTFTFAWESDKCDKYTFELSETAYFSD